MVDLVEELLARIRSGGEISAELQDRVRVALLGMNLVRPDVVQVLAVRLGALLGPNAPGIRDPDTVRQVFEQLADLDAELADLDAELAALREENRRLKELLVPGLVGSQSAREQTGAYSTERGGRMPGDGPAPEPDAPASKRADTQALERKEGA